MYRGLREEYGPPLADEEEWTSLVAEVERVRKRLE